MIHHCQHPPHLPLPGQVHPRHQCPRPGHMHHVAGHPSIDLSMEAQACRLMLVIAVGAFGYISILMLISYHCARRSLATPAATDIPGGPLDTAGPHRSGFRRASERPI